MATKTKTTMDKRLLALVILSICLTIASIAYFSMAVQALQLSDRNIVEGDHQLQLQINQLRAKQQ